MMKLKEKNVQKKMSNRKEVIVLIKSYKFMLETIKSFKWAAIQNGSTNK